MVSILRRTGLVFLGLITVFILVTGHACADDASSSGRGKEKNFRASPFLAPGYSPELGFVLAGGGLFTFSTDISNENLNRSNFNAVMGFGTTGSIFGQSLWKTYWLQDRLRANLDFWLKNMPDDYWGVGYENARYTEQGENTTAYHRLWWQINPQILYAVYTGLFIGLNFDFNQTAFSEMSPGVANDPNIQEYGTNNYNAGAGVILLYDSRDIPVNAYTGWYLSGSATFYGTYLGSDNTYQIFEIDYRQYLQIVRPGSTLVWQVYTRIGTDSVPYAELTQLGSPFDLRGYYWGRYRDRAGFYALIEYRYKFMQNRPNNLRPQEGRKESRHGFVTWVGIGWIGVDMSDLKGHYIPNIGVGYRFELQPRMNVRVDVGLGFESSGIYFNFTEAF
jgi:hypothetical protein